MNYCIGVNKDMSKLFFDVFPDLKVGTVHNAAHNRYLQIQGNIADQIFHLICQADPKDY